MTKVSMACLAGMLFFAACENNHSSTVGSYEKEESTSSSEEKGAAKEEVSNMTEKVGDLSIDTAKSIDSAANGKDTGILKLNATKVKAKIKAAKAALKS